MKKILMMLLIVCFIILVCYRTDEIVADDSNETIYWFQQLLDYQYACDIGDFDDIYIGYISVQKKTDIINQIKNTDDYADNLLHYYNSYIIPLNKRIYYEKMMKSEDFVNDYNAFIYDEKNRDDIYADGRVYNTLDYLEIMLYEYSVNDREFCDKFYEAYVNKNEQKMQSDYFRNQQLFNLDLILMSDKYYNIFEGHGYIASSVGTMVTRYTPNGTAYRCTYRATLEYDSYSLWSDDILTYHGQMITSAPNTFNCRSFAWLQGLESDYIHLWLNFEDVFINDGSFHEIPYTANKIINWQAHSGLINTVSKYNPYKGINEPYIVSKWGSGPIVAHYLSMCPSADAAPVSLAKCYSR